MRLIQSDAIELTPWADDEHAPLTTTAHGPLPAFEQLANGQTIPTARANRIPRRPAAAAPSELMVVGLCRRLYRRTRVRYLAWQLKSMRTQLDQLEAELAEALDLAVAMARRHQHSPSLQERRRLLRSDHTALAAEWLRVRQELDNLQVLL
jgi:hypothetical protein